MERAGDLIRTNFLGNHNFLDRDHIDFSEIQNENESCSLINSQIFNEGFAPSPSKPTKPV